MRQTGLPARLVAIGGPEADLHDPDEVLARHLGLAPGGSAGTLCLLRPDAYLAATLPACTADALIEALRVLTGQAATALEPLTA